MFHSDQIISSRDRRGGGGGWNPPPPSTARVKVDAVIFFYSDREIVTISAFNPGRFVALRDNLSD